MNIIYIITILAVYTLFMMIQKTEKKQNVLVWLSISAILILCYNTLICVIGTFFGMLCTLQNLSICNIIMIAILGGIILKNKNTQKYYLKVSDLIVSILILLLTIIIAYQQYGFPFSIKHEITDASTHYNYAEQFYKHSTLLYKIENNNIFDMYASDFRLPGAYTNEGILFKIFDGIVLKTELFVWFDLFVLYLSGILSYCLLKTYVKENKKTQILAVIFSILYMLGYQLNSMLYGYVYLSLALDIVIAFLIMMTIYDKREISNISALVALSLLSFGIFFSYAYFIPIIYISVIINIIVKSKKEQESIFSENNLMQLISVIIIPLILGLIYFLILPAAKGIENEISTIKTDGAIYKNYITNLLVFIPILITGIILSIKNKSKEINLPTILFSLSILFVLILFIGNKLEMVSEYYYFKAYYIIWMFAICNSHMILCKILQSQNKKLKIATYSYCGVYLLLIIIATLLTKNNIGINNIFYRNTECLNKSYVLENEEIKIIEKLPQGAKRYTFPPKERLRNKWIIALCNNPFIQSNSRKNIEEWLTLTAEKYYVVLYRDYKTIYTNESFPKENSEKYKIIHNDEYGFILERK